jgi:sugar lactone lactonase YvrE
MDHEKGFRGVKSTVPEEGKISMIPEVVVDCALKVGENPLWEPREKRVYWEDIHTGRIFRFDPESGVQETVYEGDVVGGFTIEEDGALLLFMGNGSVKVFRDGSLTTVVEEIPEERGTRFNDVIADPEGRVFCGTMPGKDHPASVYRLDRDGSITKVIEGVGLSNGMGFTADLKKLYHTDSPRRTISLYEYDRQSGALGGRSVFVRTPEGEGDPDGMTVDEEGCVWSARWDGGCIVRYSEGGDEMLRIQLPVKKVSSLTFGGNDYTDMYITTAGGDNRKEEGAEAGALFRVRTAIRGAGEFRSRITL